MSTSFNDISSQVRNFSCFKQQLLCLVVYNSERMVFYMTFYDTIRDLLNQKKSNVNRMCKSIGIGASTFRTWETRETLPNSEYLSRISDYLGVTTDTLLGKEQKNKPTAEAEGFSEEDIKFLSKIKHLSPDSKDFLVAQIDLLIARQEDQK